MKLLVAIALLVLQVCQCKDLFVCPGAARSAHTPGNLSSCEAPKWTINCYEDQIYYASKYPYQYYQCLESGAINLRMCPPSTCFLPSKGMCVLFWKWTNECVG